MEIVKSTIIVFKYSACAFLHCTTVISELSLMMSASALQEVFILLNIWQAPDSQLIVQTRLYLDRNITRPDPPPPARRTHINSSSLTLSDSLVHLRGRNHSAERQIIPAADGRCVTCGFVKIFGLLIKEIFNPK